MKILFLAVSLLSSSALAQTVEQRLFAIERFGTPVDWNDQSPNFPSVQPGSGRGGNLTIALFRPIETISPYSPLKQRLAHPEVLDDLYYESLLLPDPIQNSDRMYPLIARSIRVPQDLSYVVFELDPKAQFQDGGPVTPQDVIYSFHQYGMSSRAHAIRMGEILKSVTFYKNDVHVELKTSGQASRHAIMLLAGIKIIKTNHSGSSVVGGIKVPYVATGPYRLLALGHNRLSLIRDAHYWGSNLPTRRGFFRLNEIEVLNFNDEATARAALSGQKTNFLIEAQPLIAERLRNAMANSQLKIRYVEEKETQLPAKRSILNFNMARPAIRERKVRQALLLAYDFEGLNKAFYNGDLRRPLHTIEGSEIKPVGVPTPSVRRLMNACPINESDLGPFENYGHPFYNKIGDKRLRLLSAQNLLIEAGMKLENGVMKRINDDGFWETFRVRIYARRGDIRTLEAYLADLERLGIDGQIVDGPRQAPEEFDLVATSEEFVSPSGIVYPQNLKRIATETLPCMQDLLQSMKTGQPFTDEYRDMAEAYARLAQIFALNIYTGDLQTRRYFIDDRLKAPEGLSLERLHMYGYWQESSLEPLYFHYYPLQLRFDCDMSCLFNISR